MENNNCHFQVGSLVTANLSWQLALPISIGANFGHNPYRFGYCQFELAVGTANFDWRQFWSQPLQKFVTHLRLILFVGRFTMIGHSSSIFASFQVDDFHKRNQISNDFDSVLKKVSDFF